MKNIESTYSTVNYYKGSIIDIVERLSDEKDLLLLHKYASYFHRKMKKEEDNKSLAMEEVQ